MPVQTFSRVFVGTCLGVLTACFLISSVASAKTPTKTADWLCSLELLIESKTELPPEELLDYLYGQIVRNSLHPFDSVTSWQKVGSDAYILVSKTESPPERSSGRSHPPRTLHFLYRIEGKTGDVRLLWFDDYITAFMVSRDSCYIARLNPDTGGGLSMEEIIRYRLPGINEKLFYGGQTAYRREGARWVFGRGGAVVPEQAIVKIEHATGHKLAVRRAYMKPEDKPELVTDVF